MRDSQSPLEFGFKSKEEVNERSSAPRRKRPSPVLHRFTGPCRAHDFQGAGRTASLHSVRATFRRLSGEPKTVQSMVNRRNLAGEVRQEWLLARRRPFGGMVSVADPRLRQSSSTSSRSPRSPHRWWHQQHHHHAPHPGIGTDSANVNGDERRRFENLDRGSCPPAVPTSGMRRIFFFTASRIKPLFKRVVIGEEKLLGIEMTLGKGFGRLPLVSRCLLFSRRTRTVRVPSLNCWSVRSVPDRATLLPH